MIATVVSIEVRALIAFKADPLDRDLRRHAREGANLQAVLIGVGKPVVPGCWGWV
jgi:hypothetical protein